jgi:hypothetical protein
MHVPKVIESFIDLAEPKTDGGAAAVLIQLFGGLRGTDPCARGGPRQLFLRSALSSAAQLVFFRGITVML